MKHLVANYNKISNQFGSRLESRKSEDNDTLHIGKTEKDSSAELDLGFFALTFKLQVLTDE